MFDSQSKMGINSRGWGVAAAVHHTYTAVPTRNTCMYHACMVVSLSNIYTSNSSISQRVTRACTLYMIHTALYFLFPGALYHTLSLSHLATSASCPSVERKQRHKDHIDHMINKHEWECPDPLSPYSLAIICWTPPCAPLLRFLPAQHNNDKQQQCRVAAVLLPAVPLRSCHSPFRQVWTAGVACAQRLRIVVTWKPQGPFSMTARTSRKIFRYYLLNNCAVVLRFTSVACRIIICMYDTTLLLLLLSFVHDFARVMRCTHMFDTAAVSLVAARRLYCCCPVWYLCTRCDTAHGSIWCENLCNITGAIIWYTLWIQQQQVWYFVYTMVHTAAVMFIFLVFSLHNVETSTLLHETPTCQRFIFRSRPSQQYRCCGSRCTNTQTAVV